LESVQALLSFLARKICNGSVQNMLHFCDFTRTSHSLIAKYIEPSYLPSQFLVTMLLVGYIYD
jgi:hypothetical protein